MSTSTRLSVILPCFNPTGQWKENVLKHFLQLRTVENSIELVLVNDGSNNITSDSIRDYFAFLPEVKIVSYATNKGKGYALREGVKAASGRFIVYTDVDFPYTHSSFVKIYSALENGSDVAVGVRNSGYYAHLSTARKRISKTLRWFIKTFLRIPTDDTQCGLKGINARGKEVFLETGINRYLFDLEFIFLAARKKLAIKTEEVELRPDIKLSPMNWKILVQEFGNFLKIFIRSTINY